MSFGFSIDSLISASLITLSFLDCSFSFLNFSFSFFLNFSFSSFNCLFSTSSCVKKFSSLKISSDIETSSCSSQMSSKLVGLQLLIIFSNKLFLSNISLGWNIIFGVNSFLYFCFDESLHLLKITCQLRLVSISKSLLLIQKSCLLFGSIIVSKSHLW